MSQHEMFQQITRRGLIQSLAGIAIAPAITRLGFAEESSMDIIDTHQHLWDLVLYTPPWLKGAPEVLRHSYHLKEYKAATKGLSIKAIYMEVDVAESDHDREAEHVVELSKSNREPTIAAVIGGRPSSTGFEDYLKRHLEGGHVKGVRQVLHGETTPRGYCLSDEFVKGVRTLGKYQLSFDLCMRPTELDDGAKLVEKCPETRFIVDHCGNADPKAFNEKLSPEEKRDHDPDAWKGSMERLAKFKNVICKISGIVARAPSGWTPGHLAPIVNHCLDTFGPDRVVFGSDWPVCLLGAPLLDWVQALREIIITRPVEEQQKLWSSNAQNHYGLKL